MSERRSWDKQLDALTVEHEPMFPAALMAREERMIAEVKAAGTADGLRVGEQAPDFSLEDVGGNIPGGSFTLSRHLRGGISVLNFYRGQWCVYCSLELRSLLAIQPTVRRQGAEIVMISIEPRASAEQLTTRDPTHTPVLHDADGAVARSYKLMYTIPQELRSWWLQYDQDLPELNPATGWDLPLPGTFVIDPDRIIRARHVDMDWRKRWDPRDVRAAVRRVAASQ